MTRQRRTPEEISAIRREAGRLGHLAMGDNVAPEPGDIPSVEDAAGISLPGACSYDGAVRRPLTYADALAREKVIGEEIANEARRDDNAVRRRALYTKAQVEARERENDEMIMGQLGGLPEFCSSLVPHEDKEAARKKAREFISQLRKSIADEVARRRA